MKPGIGLFCERSAGNPYGALLALYSSGIEFPPFQLTGRIFIPSLSCRAYLFPGGQLHGLQMEVVPADS
jgi:hypothetical protein